MARKKLNLRYITKDATRRNTFKKRSQGIIKKANELATLCDIDVCAVIYEPEQEQLMVWPNEDEAKKILERFKALPLIEQRRKMSNQSDICRQKMAEEKKLPERLMVQTPETEAKRQLRMIQTSQLTFGDLGIDEVRAVHSLLENELNAIRERMAEVQAKKTTTTMDEGAREMSVPNESGASTSGVKDVMQPHMADGGSKMGPNFYNF